MDNIIWGVAATLGVVFIVFIWEFARSAYLFTVAAKWYHNRHTSTRRIRTRLPEVGGR